MTDAFKICTKCGEPREATTGKNGFCASKTARDGLHSHCRECQRKVTAVWRASHKERVKESSKYSSKQYEYQKRSRAKKPEKYRELQRQIIRRRDLKRRMNKVNVVSELWTRKEIFERDNGMCQVEECLCPDGRKIKYFDHDNKNPWCFEVDHIVLISQGGEDVRPNIRASHRRCNTNRGWSKPQG